MASRTVRVAVHASGVIGKRVADAVVTPSAHLWKVAMAEDTAEEGEGFLTYQVQVHNGAIGLPVTIDAVRALTGLEADGARSIAKTDAALGIWKDFQSRGS